MVDKNKRQIKTAGKQFKRKGQSFSGVWNKNEHDAFFDAKTEQYVQPLEFGGNTLHLVAGKPLLEDGTPSDKYTIALAYSDEWISKDYRDYLATKQDLKDIQKADNSDGETKAYLAYGAAVFKKQGLEKMRNSSHPSMEKNAHWKIYEEIEKRVKEGKATHLEKLYLRQIEEAELDAAMGNRTGLNGRELGKAIYSKEEIAGTKNVLRSNAQYDWYYKANPQKDKEIVEASPLKFWVTDKEKAEAKKRIDYRERLDAIRATRGTDSWNPWQSEYIDGKIYLLGQNDQNNSTDNSNLLAENVHQSLKNQRTIAEKTFSRKIEGVKTIPQDIPENTTPQKQEQKPISPENIMYLKKNQNDMA